MSEEPAAAAAAEPTASTASRASPLGPVELAQLAAAEARVRSIGFALKLAAFNGYGLWVSAALSLLGAVFDPWLLPSALVLAGFGYVELLGRRRLSHYDVRAPRLLCINQALFAGVLVLYAVVQLHNASTATPALAQELASHPELKDMLASSGDPQVVDFASDLGELYQRGVLIGYLVLIVLAVTMQGGSALYYASRKKIVQAYLSETPEWIVQLQRARR